MIKKILNVSNFVIKSRNMSFTQIKRKQLLKSNIETIWKFMSSPSNLSKITPKNMLFKITSDNSNEDMYEGMIITYKVAPILGIPLDWITEITHIKKNKFFVDEQKLGPYKLWHHQHKFFETKEGIIMEDIITYIPPLGIIGIIGDILFIKREVNKIFDHRKIILNDKFNK